MSLDVDQEILEDFLVEAGEILEQLSEQLVDLEQHPSDRELLNAIFRGFHTVKGGAGFLQLEPMVDCCHSAENLFDQLRNDALQVSPELMDLVLQALDSVNEMFEAVRNGGYPDAAEPYLIDSLNRMASGASADAVPAPAAPAPQPAVAAPTVTASADASDEFNMLVSDLNDEPAPAAGGDDLITEDEFENLLDDLQAKGEGAFAAAPAPATDSDLITEDEFESLLDDLQAKGEGAFAAAPEAASADQEFDQLLGQAAPVKTPAPVAIESDLITEDEFENLLDDLQAKGEGAFAAAPAAAPTPAPAAPAVAVAPEPAAAVAPAPAPAKKAAGKAAEAKAAEKKAAAETNVRVDTRLLDQIMNMVGELVLVRNRLIRLGADNEESDLTKALGSLDMVTADLQMSVMKTRMQPVKKVFGRFPRLVRDLSRQLKKEVRLELRGEDTDLDKNLVEALADPLIHLVRNAIDHGIEAPDVRQANGKPREGHVLLSAEQEGDHILLIIEDDGAGMDPDKLRQLAIDRGMLEPEAAARLSDHECFNLIFAAGFSTKKEISDVSGRGVGMDVVKTKISQLNGKLDIDSRLGQGSKIEIQVPLTLAIMPTLMVLLEEQAFALPLVNVNEIFNLDLTQINMVDGQQVIIVRDKALPLFHLKRWLVDGYENEPLPEQGHVVIANVGTVQVAFVVDQLVGQEEVVIKPLGSILHGTQGLSGATITGDGRIALILDIPSLLKSYAA